MNLDLLTKEDLQAFRVQLLNDLRELFASRVQSTEKAWLKSREVRKVLNISANTLQSFRVTGKLHPTKVGGIFYYSADEIHHLLRHGDQNKGR